MFEFAIGLGNSVGVNCEASDHLFYGRELISLLEQAQFQRPSNLLADLKIRRHARMGVDVKLNHDASVH